jgi:hypothetical protein
VERGAEKKAEDWKEGAVGDVGGLVDGNEECEEDKDKDNWQAKEEIDDF